LRNRVSWAQFYVLFYVSGSKAQKTVAEKTYRFEPYHIQNAGFGARTKTYDKPLKAGVLSPCL